MKTRLLTFLLSLTFLFVFSCSEQTPQPKIKQYEKKSERTEEKSTEQLAEIAQNEATQNCANIELNESHYDPEDAYAFGKKIQTMVRNKNLEGLYALVDGELLFGGPRKKYVKGRKAELF